jgi:hypothetical protein
VAPPPPPRGGGGHWLRQAPALFLLWSSQSHPPTLGSRDSATGVCRVSRWSVTGKTLWTCFRPRSFFFARGNHESWGVRERPAHCAGTIHPTPPGLSLILAPRAFPQSLVYYVISCLLYIINDCFSLVYCLISAGWVFR